MPIELTYKLAPLTLHELEQKHQQLCGLITIRADEYNRLGEELEILHAEADKLEQQIANWEVSQI